MNVKRSKWLWLSAAVVVPFLGGAQECDPPPPEPEPEYCFSDADCGPGAICATDECYSACREGEVCPAVCAGICEPAPEPEVCFSDADCAAGAICNTDECLSACPDGGDCIAVCAGRCEPAPEPDYCLDDAECRPDEHCNTDRCMFPGCDGEGEAHLTVCYGTCEPTPSCAPVLCDIACEHGLARDESGCEICACNPPPPLCEPVLCALYCEHGFATDDLGCPTCECASPPPERSCGGFLGLSCDDGEFCDYADDVPACGAADHLGTCRERPTACIEIFAPVCGCDGNTYGNSCFANASGVDSWGAGGCAPEPALD